MHRILGVRNELMHMIMQRNQLAGYIRDRLQLPPMLQRPHLCNRCYAQTACFTYHKLVEDGNSETSGLKEKFDDMVQHLKPIHQEFFKKWDDLITKEEGDVLKFRRELWTMLSSEREKLGRCFGAVIIEPGSAAELPDGPKINRFQYAFMKKDQGPSFSFTESQITVGEPIVISDEAGHYALANGYVTKVRRERITVAVDRRLHNTRIRNKDFDAVRNQSFAGLMEVTDIWNPKPSSIGQEPEEPVLYRLDKDEFSNGMATVRNNLIRIMEKNLFGALPLRRLIVEGVPPTFSKKPIPRDIIHAAAKTSLNVDQQNAIEKVMQAKDYALVLGMPGTGKTTTIAQIIRTLAAQGKSILLTSYTHTAVDNILLKIRDSGIGILRIGAIAKVHPEVQEFADLASVPKTTVDELEKSYSNQIVATTCLGINHPIFNQRIFDYCIVDEASQITLPVCLGPIRMARTFILVGDHYQLPPLVQNKEAQKGGLDISLFKLLSDKHPESVVNLEHQYRMCEEIMSLSNGLIYDGRLKCGTNEVASRKLNIPNITGLQAHHHKRETLSQAQIGFCPGSSMGSCWLRDMLDPSQPVVFLNTDPLLPVSREIAKGARVTNPLEVALATQIVETLLSVGIAPNDVGVITLYRSQLALLKQSLRRRGGGSSYAPSSGGSVEMHTADKFQGRDKEVVLLSLVRSNDSNNIGDLLKDWRRVNVALTRARTKLIIIGSFETISKGNELLSNFCAMIEKNLWRMDLRPGALESHLFDDSITQCSITAAPVAQGTQSKNVDIKSQNSQSKRALGIKRVPDKTGKLDAWTLLKTRPVMRDIANEVMS